MPYRYTSGNGHRGFDVARHRDVHHEHRLAPARGQCLLDHRTGDDGLARGGGGDHHVGLGEVLRKVGQRDRVAAVAAGEVLRGLQRAVRHDQPARLLVGEVARGQLDGVAGADQQYAGLAQVGEHLLGEAHRGERHRHGVCADAGFGAHPLGHREGVLQQAVQRRLQRVRLARKLVGILHLAEDLRLAQHHRIQPGGDAEQVARRVLLVVAVQELVQLAGSQTMVAAQPRQRQLLGAGGHAHVQLGAVAGGQDHRLLHAGFLLQFVQGGGGGFGVERHLFAQGDRRGEVVEPEGDQRHGVANLPAWVWRRRLSLSSRRRGYGHGRGVLGRRTDRRWSVCEAGVADSSRCGILRQPRR